MSKATLAIYGIKDRNQLHYPAYTHDHNLCLMQDGRVLQYLQLERYTRRKYDNRLDLFLEELIDKGLLQLPEEFALVSVNAFVGNAFITSGGKLRFEANRLSHLRENLESAWGYYQYETWQGRELEAYNCSQELAHIASCLPFYGAFQENSLLVHLDGAASLSNFSAFLYKGGKIQLLEYGWEMKYLANFYNDNALSFAMIGAAPGEHTSVPGKLMGYACWGDYRADIEQWLAEHNYFKEYWHREEEIFASIAETFGLSIESFDSTIPFWQDVAATLQHIFSREVIDKFGQLQQQTGARYLYYAGGCALNIVTNTQLLETGLFEQVYIPPCCNDSGLSLGAASLCEWLKGNAITTHSPYLNTLGLIPSQQQFSSELIADIAKLLMAGKVLGVCNGFGEAGPRALGNRSLLALANDKKLAERVSIHIKKREWYRPIAPIMLAEIVQEVSSTPIQPLAKYMLMDFHIKDEYRAALAGVVHVNGTARIQIIESKDDNPLMYALLSHLYKEYGVLALINTSFNVRGEPIIHRPEEALAAMPRMGLDGVVIEYKLYLPDGLEEDRDLVR